MWLIIGENVNVLSRDIRDISSISFNRRSRLYAFFAILSSVSGVIYAIAVSN
jgi:hypothetical protein